LSASHWPPNPRKTLFVFTGPYKTLPVTPNFFPFFVKIAMRELTVCMM
jgi:hypothetical protein